MKKLTIIMTGASSFTGAAFIKVLSEAGHFVIAPLRKSRTSYKGVRAKRLAELERHCRLVPNAPFGFDSFLNLIMEQKHLDILCHHGAEATNYKSSDFNLFQALENNALNIGPVLDCLEAKGCQHVCLTGTVFEPNEGVGSQMDRAFSPYGLSKSLTAQVFRYHCQQRRLRLGKFVIPNPFGPWEDLKFTSTMALNWLNYKPGVIHHPHYVRDNVPVSLLALGYQQFLTDLTSVNQEGYAHIAPSFYAESQEAFTTRFAGEMEGRLGVQCQFGIKEAKAHTEPKVRINTDELDPIALGWSEKGAWDELAQYYKQLSRFSQDS